ncbi:MAG: DUF58 domain-containing protein [Pseudomonadota bacterium]
MAEWVQFGRIRTRIDKFSARWIKRRGPVHPPLTLNYKQIFILPTGFGCLVGVIALAMLVSSLNFNNNLGLFTTFLFAGIAVLSMHVAYRNMEGIKILDSLAEPVFAGQPQLIITHLVDQRGRLRNGLRLTYPGDPDSDVHDLGSNQQGQWVLSIATRQRGWHQLDRITLCTRHPLGLFKAWSVFWPGSRFLVWPMPADAAPPLPISADQSSSHRPGDEGDEYHGLRSWREGDPIHRIAWKASQRHQDLLAREFSKPSQDRLMLSLEQTPGRNREHAIAILTRWVLDADQAGLHFGLDLGQSVVEPNCGAVHLNRCLTALAELP